MLDSPSAAASSQDLPVLRAGDTSRTWADILSCRQTGAEAGKICLPHDLGSQSSTLRTASHASWSDRIQNLPLTRGQSVSAYVARSLEISEQSGLELRPATPWARYRSECWIKLLAGPSAACLEAMATDVKQHHMQREARLPPRLQRADWNRR